MDGLILILIVIAAVSFFLITTRRSSGAKSAISSVQEEIEKIGGDTKVIIGYADERKAADKTGNGIVFDDDMVRKKHLIQFICLGYLHQNLPTLKSARVSDEEKHTILKMIDMLSTLFAISNQHVLPEDAQDITDKAAKDFSPDGLRNTYEDFNKRKLLEAEALWTKHIKAVCEDNHISEADFPEGYNS